MSWCTYFPSGNYGPVGRAIAQRLACDAKVARIVMNGKTRVLELGRSTPIVSAAFRKAVKLRDRHCQHRKCRVPAKWCDVHHIVHWLDGGETNEDNLILLCRRHHIACHEGGWQLTRHPDGTITSRCEHPQRHHTRRRRRREQSGQPSPN
jgi:HNH endonuclease